MRRSATGQELVEQLNAVIAKILKENRDLKRLVEKLTARGALTARSAARRAVQTVKRRAPKAKAKTKAAPARPARAGRKKAAPAKTRRPAAPAKARRPAAVNRRPVKKPTRRRR
jgi:hypothetical protein